MPVFHFLAKNFFRHLILIHVKTVQCRSAKSFSDACPVHGKEYYICLLLQYVLCPAIMFMLSFQVLLLDSLELLLF